MRGDHKDSERTDRHSSRVASAASPVQKSPNTPTPAAQPVQNSPNTPKKAHFSQFCTSRENFVPLAPPRPPAGRTLYRTKRQTRYKTLPTHPQRPISARFTRAGRTFYRTRSQTRYKTLPTRPPPAAHPVQNSPNTPKKAHFSPFYPSRENFVPLSPPRPPAGRTLYRSHHHDAQQGELCTALTITMPSRENYVPHPAPPPVQNSPNTHRPTSLPRISSPSTPKNGVFRLFCACWASFVAHKQPTGHAGRVFSRSMVRTDSPGGSFHWDRLLEPMSVAHGCDNGETTAGGASLRCLLRRVGAWPGSTRTIQTRPIGGCHVADRAWLRRPWAAAGPGRAEPVNFSVYGG